MQFKEMQQFVTRTVKTCFSECVSDFNTNQLSGNEKACLDSCIRRTMNIQTEIEQVFPMIDGKFKE
jgi:hypothetical protein